MLIQEKKRGVGLHAGIRLFNVQKPDRWVGPSCMFKILIAFMTYNVSGPAAHVYRWWTLCAQRWDRQSGV